MPDTKRNRPAGNGAAPTSSGRDSGKRTAPVCPDHLTATAEAAEAAALGALLLDDDARAGVPAMLTPDSFHREAHRVVFAAALAVLEDGVRPDPLTVTAKLAERGQLDEVGGPLGVSDLADMQTCPTPASWPSYCTVVVRETRRRAGIRLLRRALARLEAGEDPGQVAAELAVAV